MEWLLGIIVLVFLISRSNQESDSSHQDKYFRDLEDIDFSNTSISLRPNSVKSKKKKTMRPGKWLGLSESFQLQEFSFTNGFVYVGEWLDDLHEYDCEASLINPKLKVSTKKPDWSGDSLSYWPSYSDISPSARAAYLEWLANGRNKPDACIGYVFLYFYGMERRLLVDGPKGLVSSSEKAQLIKEIKRLQNLYGDNKSFFSYSTQLLNHIKIETINVSEPKISDYLTADTYNSFFKFSLSKTVSAGSPVPLVLALAWIKGNPDIGLRTPASRCEKKFDYLFAKKFHGKYPNGMKVKPNRTKLKFHYHPASPSLRGLKAAEFDLPDPSRLKKPLTQLMSIADECIDILDGYSRYIGRGNSKEDSFLSLAQLPIELSETIQSKQFHVFKAFLSDKLKRKEYIIPIKQILTFWGDEKPIKVNKPEAINITKIFELAGFCIAPNYQHHHAKPLIDGVAVIYKCDNPGNLDITDEYQRMVTMIRLGAMIARADGVVSESEVEYLSGQVRKNKHLSDLQVSSLSAYLEWCLIEEGNAVGLKAKLKKFTDDDKQALVDILVNVAHADGRIDPLEVKQLEKFYTTLGLEKAKVVTDLHDFSASSKSTTKPLKRVSGSEFKIDLELLKLHEEQTSNVRGVLDAIFAEEMEAEDNLEIEEQQKVDELSHSSLIGLDESHQRLYKNLITKEQWTEKEVNQLCGDLDLMSAAAIENINDWVYDNIESVLIEDGNPLFIDLELVQEIANL